MKTHFVAIAENKVPSDLRTLPWAEWRNVTDPKQLPCMAAHKHLRERGGFDEDMHSLRLFVFVRTTMALPCVVHSTELIMSKEQAPATCEIL